MTLPDATLLPDAAEAREYNRKKRWLEISDTAVSIGFLVLLLLTGWTNNLRDLATHIAPNYYYLRLFYYVLFLSILSKVIGLPLDYYGFSLEHRFNLSNQKLASWTRDSIRGWLLGLVLATVLVEIIYWLIRISPDYWWFLAWMIFVAMFVFFAQIAPVLLFPLFYKFAPLQNEELKQRLVRLGERAGAHIRGVYEWKLSEKSKKANAALTGLGSTRRIILADTLLENYNDDEIEAVLAHELGHHVHGHMTKMIVVEALVTLAGFWAANQVLRYAIDQQKMFEHLTDFANLPLLVLASSLISLLLLPAINAYTRLTERQADVYCWKSVPSIDPYVSAMEKLNKQNLSESNPSRIVEVLFHSHPPVAKRIAAAQEWARKHRPSLAT